MIGVQNAPYRRLGTGLPTLAAAFILGLQACGQEPSFVEQQVPSEKTADAEASGQSERGNSSEFGGQSAGNDGLVLDCNSEDMACIAEKLGCATNDPECVYGKAGSEDLVNLRFASTMAVQKGPGKVDILWIVDNSGSMQEEQQYLGANFRSFIQALDEAGTNFQTAVTSTGVCSTSLPTNLADRACPSGNNSSSAHHRGRFIGTAGQQVIKYTDSDMESRFLQYANVGINGSGFEHGLWGAKLALDRVANGSNDPLIRDDAFLAVVVVSDEEDDGIGLGMTDFYTGRNFINDGVTSFRWDHNQMIQHLNQVKGKNKFSISTITGTRNANGNLCSAAHSQPQEEGTQYINAAEATGGIVQSICESDWSESLTKIGLDLNAQITQIVLKDTPIQGTIKVKVNSVEVSDWDWISGNNAIKFHADAIPSEGDNIEVSYVTID